MHKNKAIQILKSFSPEEFKRFRKFIESPYFNTSKSAIQLFKYIEKYYPAFEDKALDIKSAVKKLNKISRATEGNIRNTLSDLYLLLRKFLSIEYYNSNDFAMKFGEVASLFSKRLLPMYEKESATYFEKYGKINNFHEPYMHETLLLCNARIANAFGKANVKGDIEAFVKQSEIAALTALDYIFHTRLLKEDNKFSHNVEYPDMCSAIFDALDVEKFLNYAEKNSPKFYNIVAMEYYVTNLHLNRDFESSHQKLKKLFSEQINTYESKNSYWGSFIASFTNVLMNKINFNSTHKEIPYYASEILYPYDFYLKHKLYHHMSSWFLIREFTNIIYIAFIAEKPEWIKEFILKYSNELKADEKGDGVNFGLGLFNYMTGKYEEALSNFSNVKNPFQNMLIKMKKVIILCHYELKNYETALSNCDALIMLLTRKFGDMPAKQWEIEEIKLFRKFLKVMLSTEPDAMREFERELSIAKPRASYFVSKLVRRIGK